MDIIEPSFKVERFMERGDVIKNIELYGRVAYKSEDKITDESAAKFVSRVISLGHESVLEHGTHIFRTAIKSPSHRQSMVEDLLGIKEGTVGLHFSFTPNYVVISANVRTIRDAKRFVDNCLANDLLRAASAECPALYSDLRARGQQVDEFDPVQEQISLLWLPPEQSAKHLYATVRFICDRGVSHEDVRHRTMSLTQESTRYCNYLKKGIQFIKPLFWDTASDKYAHWKAAMEHAEFEYNWMISNGASPQEARSVLPNSLKTEIVQTANFVEWRHIFSLRADSHAHPQMQQLMYPLKADFHNRLPMIF